MRKKGKEKCSKGHKKARKAIAEINRKIQRKEDNSILVLNKASQQIVNKHHASDH